MRIQKKVVDAVNDAVNNKLQAQYRELEVRLFMQQRRIMIASICSMFLAVLINELCAAGDYRSDLPSIEEQLELDSSDRPARQCTSGLALPLKLAALGNSITLVVLVSLKFKTQCQARSIHTKIKGGNFSSSRLRRGLSMRLGFLGVSLGEAWYYFLFAAKVVLMAVHAPPMMERDFRLEVMGVLLYYRLESVACAIAMPRVSEV